jgi:hypothetical protein
MTRTGPVIFGFVVSWPWPASAGAVRPWRPRIRRPSSPRRRRRPGPPGPGSGQKAGCRGGALRGGGHGRVPPVPAAAAARHGAGRQGPDRKLLSAGQPHHPKNRRPLRTGAFHARQARQRHQGLRPVPPLSARGRGGMETTRCSACHQEPFQKDHPERLGLKAAYHQQCMGCHKEMDKGPIDCAGCHRKNVPDHKALIQLAANPEPSQVTSECLRCHQPAGEDMLKSAHWLWKGPSPLHPQPSKGGRAR